MARGQEILNLTALYKYRSCLLTSAHSARCYVLWSCGWLAPHASCTSSWIFRPEIWQSILLRLYLAGQFPRQINYLTSVLGDINA